MSEGATLASLVGGFGLDNDVTRLHALGRRAEVRGLAITVDQQFPRRVVTVTAVKLRSISKGTLKLWWERSAHP